MRHEKFYKIGSDQIQLPRDSKLCVLTRGHLYKLPIGEFPLWLIVASKRMWVQSLALLSGLRIEFCHGCGVGLQLHLIRPLTWELPYAAGEAKKKKERKKFLKNIMLKIKIN